MCGIFGCINFNPSNLERARCSLDKLTHRGPDQRGEWYDNFAYLGHRRLSIIDLSEAGKQPFVDKDNETAVMVNGEIYNFRELRKEIGEEKFDSDSDSEVILHGFKLWGIEKLLKKIDGMYAIIIYQIKKKETIIARDRFGKKPIFFCEHNNQFIFSSEVKSIFEFDASLRKFSFEGIKSWMLFRGIQDKRTIFSKIYRLNPSEYLKIDASLNVSNNKYYDIMDYCSNNSVEINEVEELVKNGIKKRLISDVPIGIQLSGGIDSSLITGFLSELHETNLETFSVVLKDDENPTYSEKAYSDFVARRWNNNHNEYVLSENDFKNNFEETIYHFDGMLDYPNSVPLMLLSELAKEKVTVFLTGEGADEVFGGYSKFSNYLSNIRNKTNTINFHENFSLRNMRFFNSYLRLNFLREKYNDEESALNYLNSYISPETFSELFGQVKNKPLDFIDKSNFRTLPISKKLMILDIKNYLFSLLERQDRVTMAKGMEARLPFLDKDLTEKIMSVDDKLLISEEVTKIPLKKLSEKMYGKKFTYRRKVGFPLPINKWLEKGGLLDSYRQRILDKDFLLYKYVDSKKLEKWFSSKSFDYKLLNYSDSEKMWVMWYLVVLRKAQDIFSIDGINSN